MASAPGIQDGFFFLRSTTAATRHEWPHQTEEGGKRGGGRPCSGSPPSLLLRRWSMCIRTSDDCVGTVVCRYVSLSVYQHPSLPCISSPGQPSSVRPLVYSAGENQGEDQKALPMLSFILVVYVCALFAHISSGGCKQSNKCSCHLRARSH